MSEVAARGARVDYDEVYFRTDSTNLRAMVGRGLHQPTREDLDMFRGFIVRRWIVDLDEPQRDERLAWLAEQEAKL